MAHKNKGDFRVWRDLVNGKLGVNGDINFDIREFTTRNTMQGIVFPATEQDEGSIVPIGSAAEKDWTYYWHLEDKSEYAYDELENLRGLGYKIATTENFKPNRDYYRTEGDKIFWKRNVLYVLDRERAEQNERDERRDRDLRMNGLMQADLVGAAAKSVDIRSEAFDIFDNKEVKSRGRK